MQKPRQQGTAVLDSGNLEVINSNIFIPHGFVSHDSIGLPDNTLNAYIDYQLTEPTTALEWKHVRGAYVYLPSQDRVKRWSAEPILGGSMGKHINSYLVER